MPKNIVICCDGTGNEFGRSNSNVVKLYQTLICDERQITYYHPGLGTMGARNALTRVSKWWTRTMGLAFGYGIADNVADAYQFLMQVFEPDDRVYLFGFSRGAYTARALAGMLRITGLLTKGNDALIPYAIRMVKRKTPDFEVAAKFRKTFSRECAPHFIGVWDTVSSVGWVYNAVHFPYTTLAHNSDPRIVRHAVSIDERRAFFRQNLFGPPHSSGQDVQEVWFAGVHSDVGGGYPEAESQLSKITLQWMLREAVRAGLCVDAARQAEILGGTPPWVAPDPGTSNQHESLHGWWYLAELWPKIVHVMRGPSKRWTTSIRVNLGRRRWIASNALVHASVEQRLANAALEYTPSNLPPQRRIVDDRPPSSEAIRETA